MFSFVDMRLALLLSAAVLLVRAQGEDDRKFHRCLFTGAFELSSPASPLQPSLTPHTFLGISLLGWTAAEFLYSKKKRSSSNISLDRITIRLAALCLSFSLSLFLAHLSPSLYLQHACRASRYRFFHALLQATVSIKGGGKLCTFTAPI